MAQRRRPATSSKAARRITLRVPPREETSVEPEDIPLNIVYEDDAVAVIDKRAGMVAHPGTWQQKAARW